MSLAPEWLDAIQWPALLASIAAAWLVASDAQQRRNVGFWIFLSSNALWIVWGVHTGGRALVTLQLALAAMNIRGLKKTTQETTQERELEGRDGCRRRPTSVGDMGGHRSRLLPVSMAECNVQLPLHDRTAIRMQKRRYRREIVSGCNEILACPFPSFLNQHHENHASVLGARMCRLRRTDDRLAVLGSK